MLSTDEVKHIATLARIGLTDDEVTHFKRDLSTILDWFDQLKDVDASGAPAETSMAPESNRAALDADRLSGEAPQILENAPNKKGDYFKVKSVF
jgi:aspartyl-tRNA(Asn)/glutamyl-tRNA(Gln) amidotransferase subunit C